jgi:hypothetical protein
MNKKDRRTIQAPTQYKALEYWELKIICPIKESGIVMEIPTVTTNGVVRSMAYAQQ